MSKIKRNKEIMIAPLIVLILLSIVFIIKGVYPFGSKSIAYYDMPLQYVPLYHHTYDVLHGDASPFFDWYNGGGVDFTTNSTTYLFNPMNIFFLFIKRENLIYSMSFFLAIKLMLSSASMAFYLRKKSQTGCLVNIALSLMYTFSGYSLQNYVNIFFLDLVILFPLFMLALEHMLNKEKPFWYTVVTAYMLLINSYLGAMVLLFTVFYTAGHILFIQKDNNLRKRIATNLGVYTAVAFLISAVLLIPVALRLSDSPRLTVFDVKYSDIVTTREGEFDVQKQFMLFGSEFGIASLALTIFKLQKNKQELDSETKFSAYLMLLLIIPIISEGCNLMWHMGSYAHFPYRFGFIVTFTSIRIFANFLSKHNEATPVKAFNSKPPASLKICLAIIMAIAEMILLGIMCFKLSYQSIPDMDSYIFYGFILILSLLAAILILNFCNKKTRSAIIIILAVLQSGFGIYAFIAPKKYIVTPNNYIELKKSNFSIPDDHISRMKQLNYNYHPNYQQYIGLPALSDWSLNISHDYWETNTNLGYSCEYTDSYDNGGTAFTDALLNVKQAFSTRYFSNDLYTLTNNINNIYFYDCNYTLPFGILTPELLSDIEIGTDKIPFENQNALYKSITATNKTLFNVSFLTDVITDDKSDFDVTLKTPNTFAASIEITEPSVLYAYTTEIDNSYQFIINGKSIILPYRTLDDNKVYPTPKDNGIIYLGSFDNEQLKISIASNDKDTSKLCFGVMSIPKLEQLCSYYNAGSHAYDVEASGSSLSMKVDDPQGRYIFIPVEYSKNWTAKVNGSKAEIIPTLNGSFMAIKLGNEDAEIEMEFIPYDTIRCLFISLLGIALFIVLIFTKKKGHDIANIKALNTVALVCFAAVAAIALIVVYAIPSVGYFIEFFKEISEM